MAGLGTGAETGAGTGGGLAGAGEEDPLRLAEANAYDAAVVGRPPAGGGVAHVGLLENCDKLAGCTMPTLILHGSADRIVPPAQAVQAHRASGAKRKQLQLIQGAGHNDISMSEEYFKAIAAFVDSVMTSDAPI